MVPALNEHSLFGPVAAGLRWSHHAQTGPEPGYLTGALEGMVAVWVLGRGTKASPWLQWPHRLDNASLSQYSVVKVLCVAL